MEVVDETMGSNDHSTIIKGRRTKRQRQSSPHSITMSTTSSSNTEGIDGDGHGGHGGDDFMTMSPTASTEFAAESTEEEEDMANCLIMLAKGLNPKPTDHVEESETQFKYTATPAAKTGLYVYDCKTCNRSFPSFQALGGHRASHKKPKAATMVEEIKKPLVLYEDEIQFNNSTSPPVPSTPSLVRNRVVCGPNKSPKVHECSICGAEFSSGQALGGHMRRHRTTTTTNQMKSESEEVKKPRHVFALDLNLPAPEEDRENNKFAFVSKQQSMIYSASQLVDCHY